MKKILFGLLLPLLCSAISMAQNADTVKQEKIHFTAGISYNSAINYYGRTDSLKTSGLFPSLGLSLSNGLYLNSTFVWIRNAQQSGYAATLLEGGYNFKNKKGNWAGNISGSKFFYQISSDLIQSAIKEMGAASLTQLNNILNVTIGADVKFSNQTDIGAHAGLDHTIRMEKVLGKGILVIDPSAYIYSGTQHFTETYYQQKSILFIPVDQQQVTQNSQKFNILSYEFSMPVVYVLGKASLTLTPAYVMPQHLIVVSGQPSQSERGTNLFYFTAGLRISL